MFLVILSTFETLAMLKSVWWTRRKRARCAVIRNGARLLLLSTRWTFIITWLYFFFALARSAEKWLTKCVWITTFSFFIFIWFPKKIKERLKFSRAPSFLQIRNGGSSPKCLHLVPQGAFSWLKISPRKLCSRLCVLCWHSSTTWRQGGGGDGITYGSRVIIAPPPLLHGSSQQSLLFFSSTPTFSRPRYIYFG